MRTIDQTTAPQTLLPAGAPIHSERIASTTIVNGLISANHCSADGIESTGTNADEMNVSGNTAMKPSELADSGDDTNRPSSAKTHENAYPNRISSPSPASTSSKPAWNENPMIRPVVSST